MNEASGNARCPAPDSALVIQVNDERRFLGIALQQRKQTDNAHGLELSSETKSRPREEDDDDDDDDDGAEKEPRGGARPRITRRIPLQAQRTFPNCHRIRLSVQSTRVLKDPRRRNSEVGET